MRYSAAPQSPPHSRFPSSALFVCRGVRRTAALLAAGLLVVQLLFGMCWAQSATAPANLADQSKNDDAKPGSDWVRLLYDKDGQLLGMQTAIVRYTADPPAGADPEKQPVEVDLIGAIHIADADYYRKLNQRFKQYDALLYELVAADGTVVPRGHHASNANPLGAMQNGMKSMLELEHQLEQIDYTPKNFVHADMSPDDFLQSMKDRNEGFVQMYFRLLGQSLAYQSEMAAKGESIDADLLAAMFAKDRARRLKIALAKQLVNVESMMSGFGGDEGSVLISERNKTALNVLRQQLEAGKKRLGIFYGAGHLTDMDARLRRDFGLRPVSVVWLTAWNLAASP